MTRLGTRTIAIHSDQEREILGDSLFFLLLKDAVHLYRTEHLWVTTNNAHCPCAPRRRRTSISKAPRTDDRKTIRPAQKRASRAPAPRRRPGTRCRRRRLFHGPSTPLRSNLEIDSLQKGTLSRPDLG